jgi:cytochrome c-type biogenesis protein
MISSILSGINSAFSQPAAAAFAAAAAWGFLSVLLSPCHLGAIPLIVAYINNGKKPDRRRALLFSLLFGLGLLVTLAVIGIVTSMAGKLLGDVGPAGRVAVGTFLVICGLWLMDVPPFSRINFSFSARPGKRGAAGALSLGLIYGVILGPCSFAFLAPMLGFIFSAGNREVAYGAVLMCFYALGHTAAIIAAGTFGDFISALLIKSKRAEKGAVWFKRILGALVLVVGTRQIIG